MTRLLDRASEFMDIYPEVVYDDPRGNPGMRKPSDKPIRIRVTTSYDRGSIAEVTGQVASDVVRVLTRYAPVAPWARVRFRDQDWDLATPPRQTVGGTRNTRHTEFTIKSRNNPPVADDRSSAMDGYRPPGSIIPSGDGNG